MGRKSPAPFSMLIVVGTGLLSACATPGTPAVEDVVVRHYTPTEIIVPGSSVGRFQSAAGCIFFHYENRRHGRVAALFPPGTRSIFSLSSTGILKVAPISSGVRLTMTASAQTAWKMRPSVISSIDPSWDRSSCLLHSGPAPQSQIAAERQSEAICLVRTRPNCQKPRIVITATMFTFVATF